MGRKSLEPNIGAAASTKAKCDCDSGNLRARQSLLRSAFSKLNEAGVSVPERPIPGDCQRSEQQQGNYFFWV
jgi:hypothetical protein